MGAAMGSLFSECKRCSALVDQCDLCPATVRQTDDDPLLRRLPGPRPHEYQPTNLSEAELLQHALRLSELEVANQGHLAGALMADPPVASSEGSPQEEALERARLREEQQAEYEESLRIDRERAAEKALRQKEEEERQRQESEELESKVKQAEAEEQAKKEKMTQILQEAQQMLPPEPAADEAILQFLIRTPDGRRLKRAFNSENTIGQVYAFVLIEGGEALQSRSFRLVETMPRRTYEDREQTLAAAGLKGQCTLLVEVTDDH